MVKSKKSSRLNAKKEDKVELFVDKNWQSENVPPGPRRSTW